MSQRTLSDKHSAVVITKRLRAMLKVIEINLEARSDVRS